MKEKLKTAIVRALIVLTLQAAGFRPVKLSNGSPGWKRGKHIGPAAWAFQQVANGYGT